MFIISVYYLVVNFLFQSLDLSEDIHLCPQTIFLQSLHVIRILKLLRVTKTEMKRIIASFEDSVERLRSNVSTSIFNQIIHTDHQTKINKLKVYVSR